MAKNNKCSMCGASIRPSDESCKYCGARAPREYNDVHVHDNSCPEEATYTKAGSNSNCKSNAFTGMKFNVPIFVVLMLFAPIIAIIYAIICSASEQKK